jgi:plastocyanin
MFVSRSLRLGLLVVFCGAATAWAAPQRAAVVTINLTEAGVVVTPAVITVAPGEEVEWRSDHAFAIAVERNATLFGRELPPQALRARAGRGQASVRARTGQNAPAGAYKYSVGVWDGENVWVVDPEVVIRPGT